MPIRPSGTPYHAYAKAFDDSSGMFRMSAAPDVENRQYVPEYAFTNTLGLDFEYYEPTAEYNVSIYGGNHQNLKYPGYVHLVLPAGQWHFELNGARGGDYGGFSAYGRGARLHVYYTSREDEMLVLAAGARGFDVPWFQGDNSGASGGGGSYIYSLSRNEFIAVAAGGNGSGDIFYRSRWGANQYFGSNANGANYINTVPNSQFMDGMPITSYSRYLRNYSAFGGATITDDDSGMGGASDMGRYGSVTSTGRTASGTESASGKSAVIDPISYLLSCGDNAYTAAYGSFSDDAGMITIRRNNATIDTMYRALIEAYPMEEIAAYMMKHDPSFLIHMFNSLPESLKRDVAQVFTPQLLDSIEPKISKEDFASVMYYKGESVEMLRYFRNADTLSLFELPEEMRRWNKNISKK